MDREIVGLWRLFDSYFEGHIRLMEHDLQIMLVSGYQFKASDKTVQPFEVQGQDYQSIPLTGRKVAKLDASRWAFGADDAIWHLRGKVEATGAVIFASEGLCFYGEFNQTAKANNSIIFLPLGRILVLRKD